MTETRDVDSYSRLLCRLLDIDRASPAGRLIQAQMIALAHDQHEADCEEARRRAALYAPDLLAVLDSLAFPVRVGLATPPPVGTPRRASRARYAPREECGS